MSKKNFIAIGVVAIILIIILVVVVNQRSTNSNQTSSSSSISKTTQSASTSFETITTVQDLKKMLDAKNPNDVLLDVRTRAEFDAGHIQGAVNIDIENQNFSSQIQNLDKTKTYITFCRSGNRALVASEELTKISLKTVYSKQGFTLWQGAGFAIVK
jgi:rhodanese-related sulfurtransferase